MKKINNAVGYAWCEREPEPRLRVLMNAECKKRGLSSTGTGQFIIHESREKLQYGTH
jgi:hypothetical protein